VVIEDSDLMIMPPLEGFVMNRVTGDYFETLLYKIFVSMDEQTTVGEMASLLQVELYFHSCESWTIIPAPFLTTYSESCIRSLNIFSKI
jgi:hypothetical protein